MRGVFGVRVDANADSLKRSLLPFRVGEAWARRDPLSLLSHSIQTPTRCSRGVFVSSL
ncbi:MAG: hypothetical protein JWM63_989 [Gammaproteobacteria bacterium]|nr:hypothetical protein [Gammaproteobacteria bacterium]